MLKTPRIANILKETTGAMFGMDARVALVIASVLAAAGGISIMSQLERSRVQAAEYGTQAITNALANYYRTVDQTSLPRTFDELIASGLLEDTSLREDPWGNNWSYSITSRDLSIENIPVKVFYAVVVSSGKDGVTNSSDVATPAEWDAWQPKGDDIGTKFSTIEIEKQRVADYVEQGRLIIAKLEELEQSRYVEVSTTCTTTPDNPVCKVQSRRTGAITEYVNFNFYPQSSLDTSEDTVYYGSLFENEPVFVSGNLQSMEQMMSLLQLPTYFAKNPWGKVLTYHSNIYERNTAPFRATIWLEE